MVGVHLITAGEGVLPDFYEKYGFHSKGIGYAAWCAVEKLHPVVKVWETVTPYFEKRNIHFYVNKCGFHIVAYHNKWNPIMENGKPSEDEMFVFRKEL